MSPADVLRGARRSPMVIAIVIAVVAISGSVAFAMTRGGSTASAAPTTTTTTVAATVGTMRESVVSSGTIEPAVEDDLNFPVSGRVTSVAVTAGATVKKGQLLATLDSAALAAAVAEARAAVASDQARVDSDSSSSASAAQVAADDAALTTAETQLSDAQANLASARLVSPIAGTVTAVNLSVGQQVTGSGMSTNGSGASGGGAAGGTGNGSSSAASGNSGGSGGTATGSSTSTAAFVVVSTGKFVVNATVDDTEVKQLTAGMEATITPTGASTPIYGTVASVGLVPSSTSGTVQFPVVIDVTGTQTGLYGGSSATVSILVKQLANVLEVPTQAIHYNGTSATVTVDKSGTKSTRDVTVGLTSSGMTQILSGLKQGEEVVVTTFTRRPGTGTGTGTGQTGTGGGFGRGFGTGGPPGGFGGNG